MKKHTKCSCGACRAFSQDTEAGGEEPLVEIGFLTTVNTHQFDDGVQHITATVQVVGPNLASGKKDKK